jgi:hypothetical protein
MGLILYCCYDETATARLEAQRVPIDRDNSSGFHPALLARYIVTKKPEAKPISVPSGPDWASGWVEWHGSMTYCS